MPASIHVNEKVVMACESIAGKFGATPAAASVVYKMESERAERFRCLVRMEGNADAVNAALAAADADEEAVVGGKYTDMLLL